MSDAAADFEVIQRSRRYYLVAGDDFYGVWDLDVEAQNAIERYPGTDEGLDQAEDRFRSLRRHDRIQRWVSVRTLGIVFSVSVVAWIVGGVVLAIGYVGEPPFSFEAALILNEVGFHLGVSALAILIAIVLVRLVRRLEGPNTQGARPNDLSPPWRGGVGTVVLGAGSLGLAVWVLSALVNLFLPPEAVPLPGDSPFVAGFVERPSPASLITRAAGTLGFRVWVSALVFLLIGWTGALRRSSSEGDAPGK